jgi:hypothetical protein
MRQSLAGGGMRRWRLLALAVVLVAAAVVGGGALLGRSCGKKAGEFERLDAPERLVAIGDIHGSMWAWQQALRKAGAIDEKGEWIGGRLEVVFTGDLIDRGDDDLEILRATERLKQRAAKAGGKVIVLTGNHEAANVEGLFIEVSDKGFEQFNGEVTEKELELPYAKKFKPARKARAVAFRPGGPLATKLSANRAAVLIGDTVFVHGGLLPDHVTYGLKRMNGKLRDWMSGKTKKRPDKAVGRDGPLWIRDYSEDPDDGDCKHLAKALSLLGAKRMVVGHTIQDHINSACDGQVWRIDTGMNPTHFNGPIEVLEIRGDEVAPIR